MNISNHIAQNEPPSTDVMEDLFTRQYFALQPDTTIQNTKCLDILRSLGPRKVCQYQFKK